MKIGIVGAGNVGKVLARKIGAGNHSVKIANSRGPDTIGDVACDVGVIAVSKEQAVIDVDVIILSVPFVRSPELGGLFHDVPAEVVVIDTSNYFPYRDGKIGEVDDGKPESVWVSEQIGRPVIKAWNALMAETISGSGVPEGMPGRIAVPVAGDDAKAKQIAMQLVDLTGFDAVDAGALAESWRLQPGSPAYCTEFARDELVAALAVANRQRAPENRETLIRELSSRGGNITHAEIIALTRTVTA